MDFAHTAAMSASSIRSTPLSSAASARIGGVPVSQPPSPAAASCPSRKANGAACPIHPVTGWRIAPHSARATCRKAGAPGPPFRYLYPHPTASRAPSAASDSGTAPMLWLRSHTTGTPAGRASASIAAMSCRRPER